MSPLFFLDVISCLRYLTKAGEYNAANDARTPAADG